MLARFAAKMAAADGIEDLSAFCTCHGDPCEHDVLSCHDKEGQAGS